MTTTTSKKQAAAEAAEQLRANLEPGDTVWTILRHVSKSGMLRCISPVAIDRDDADPAIWDFGYLAARALDERLDRDRGGVRMSGAGMDMGFQLVYTLGRVMFPDGFDCIGAHCPSNDHSNGDRDYTPHRHTDGGYALRHRWL